MAMTKHEAAERALMIWPGARIASVNGGTDGTQRWEVSVPYDSLTHTLDGNGHATCHGACNEREEALNQLARSNKTKPRKPTGAERMDALLEDLTERTKLRSWSAFVEDSRVPSDLMPAVITQRAELVRVVKPRILTASEHEVYLSLIATLLETNQALREHAQHVAQLTNNLVGHLTGFHSAARNIEHFANFRAIDNGDEE